MGPEFEVDESFAAGAEDGVWRIFHVILRCPRVEDSDFLEVLAAFCDEPGYVATATAPEFDCAFELGRVGRFGVGNPRFDVVLLEFGGDFFPFLL